MSMKNIAFGKSTATRVGTVGMSCYSCVIPMCYFEVMEHYGVYFTICNGIYSYCLVFRQFTKFWVSEFLGYKDINS